MITSTFCRRLVVLLTAAMPARAQGTGLSTADSNTVARSAAREVLATRPAPSPLCIIDVADSLGTPAGRAFVTEARAITSKMNAVANPAGNLSIDILRLSGRDTVRVTLQLRGNDGDSGKTAWINHVAFDFVRDASPIGWRFVARKPLYFADMIITESPPATQPRCLNGRR